MTTTVVPTHQLKSVQRMLRSIPECADLRVHRQRARRLVRPSLGIKETGTSESDHGRALLESRVTWQIDVMGSDIWETKRLRGAIVEYIRQADLIPLRFFNWAYPQVRARPAEVVAGDPTETWHVGVTALDHEGEESLAATDSCVIAANDDVEVLWPDWPAIPIATGGYRLYAGSSADALRLYATAPAAAKPSGWWNAATLGVNSANPIGAAPPRRSEMFANRFLHVVSVGSRDVEHPSRDGIWNSYITMVTCLYSSRLAMPGVEASDVPRPFSTITVTTTAAP